jgi:hypothetical protein
MISNIGIDHKIDYLYMDNTFCTPDEDFPSQRIAYEKIEQKISDLRKSD